MDATQQMLPMLGRNSNTRSKTMNDSERSGPNLQYENKGIHLHLAHLKKIFLKQYGKHGMLNNDSTSYIDICASKESIFCQPL